MTAVNDNCAVSDNCAARPSPDHASFAPRSVAQQSVAQQSAAQQSAGPQSAAPVPSIPGCTDTRPSDGWRVRAAPIREPHFDDEQPVRHLSLVARQAQALPFASAPVLQGAPPSSRRLIAVPARDFSAVPTRRNQLPEVERFGRHFITGLLEVLAGRRSVSQLAPLTSAGIHAGIVRDALGKDRLGCAGHHPALQSIRVMEPADGVAELSAVVVVGRRCRAIAARLEGLDGRWRCVRLQIG